MFSKFFIYTNLWIALCATAGVTQTLLLLDDKIEITAYTAFVFFSTLLLYGLHRIIGIKRVGKYVNQGRFAQISSQQRATMLLTLLSGGLGFYYFLQLKTSTQLLLLIPAGISFLYVLPILKGNTKRLRDLDFTKIFMIAPVWAWVTVVGSANELSHSLLSASVILLFLERMFFLFAIAIPFDIRDLNVDIHTEVKTIPSTIGIKKSKLVALTSLAAMTLSTALNLFTGGVNFGTLVAVGISGVLTGLLIWKANHEKKDLYFSGFIDAMMILQFLFVWFLH